MEKLRSLALIVNGLATIMAVRGNRVNEGVGCLKISRGKEIMMK